MKQKQIDFRELLERLLPLDRLPAADRLRVQRALTAGVSDQIEQASRLSALAQLEQAGALRRLPDPAKGEDPVVRYQSGTGLDVITVHVPGPRERAGVQIRPALGAARAGAGAPRPGPPAASTSTTRCSLADPRRARRARALIDQLDHAGREFLGAERRAASRRRRGRARTRALRSTARSPTRRGATPTTLFYCPDTARSPALADAGRRRGVGSFGRSRSTSGDGHVLGHLEVHARVPARFPPDDCRWCRCSPTRAAGALERAARIEKLVFVDPLTAAYNRSYFDLQLAQRDRARPARAAARWRCFIADIDDFKSFNTSFGYEAGNQVLVQVAQALRDGVRPFDTVARWGGEEFAVLLTSPVDARRRASTISERLRARSSAPPIRLEGLDGRAHRVNVTVSVGVAMFPDHAATAEDLWRAANQALLRAKRPPKNQVVFFHAPAPSRLRRSPPQARGRRAARPTGTGGRRSSPAASCPGRAGSPGPRCSPPTSCRIRPSCAARSSRSRPA